MVADYAGSNLLIMALTFAECTQLFDENKFADLSADPSGQRFLVIRSLSRTEHLQTLFRSAKLPVPKGGTRELFRQAFGAAIGMDAIETCVREIYARDRESRRIVEEDLLNQLYLVQEFTWGGLHQSNLEKTIVDNYVKKITAYDALCRSIENELLNSLRGYVICSWYYHWTSIIIEDIFKDHDSVLPAVGLVKKIDFFVQKIPFDLKVTTLPEGYLAARRHRADLRPELTLLKQAARKHKIPVNAELPNTALLQDLWMKVSDHPDAECNALIGELTKFRNELVDYIEKDPTELIVWLYEFQGERRFDSANRLFLVLADQRNFFDSWKLKRAKPRLESQIRGYLDGVGTMPGRKITFDWQGRKFTAISDVIVVRST